MPADLLADRLPGPIASPLHCHLMLTLLCSFLYFPSFFFFTSNSWLSIHIPLRVDDFALEVFSTDLGCLPYHSDLWLILCASGAKKIWRFHLKMVLAHFSSNHDRWSLHKYASISTSTCASEWNWCAWEWGGDGVHSPEVQISMIPSGCSVKERTGYRGMSTGLGDRTVEQVLV